ncbi:MAG: hypothetical protein J1F31_05890 [Erysipelotrichales bacterium]|nr:hypothetical protein [Erysipelotrichales bacterium]
MNEMLKDNFLNEYFLCEHILRPIVINKIVLFNKLATIFLIPQDVAEELQDVCFNSAVQDIHSNDEYMQYCRTQNYFENSNYSNNLSEQVKRTIQIKGNAIKHVPFDTEKATRTAIVNRLYESASSGSITSMRILGFMECEGIYLTKNPERGYKNIEKAAKWNNIESILMALYYNKNERELNLQRLFSITNKTIYEDIVNDAEEVYNLKAKRVVLPECKLLKKTFEQNSSVKAEVYNPQYARLIFSNVINETKKNRVISFSKNQNIAEVLDLPLNLSFTPSCVNLNTNSFCLENREEHKEVLSYLDLIRLGSHRGLKPLCITSNSKYVLKLYKKFLSRCFLNSNIEDIDVQDLSRYDIEPTKENIFLRRCNEDKNNIYFLTFNGEIEHELMERVLPFVQNDKRSKFLIVNLSVEANLDAIIPICFCDKANAQNLKKHCDIVEFSSFNMLEKSLLLDEMINMQKENLKIQNIEIEDEVKNSLLKRSIDDMDKIIEKSLLFAQKNNGCINISLNIYKSIISKENKHSKSYGFEVKKNEA